MSLLTVQLFVNTIGSNTIGTDSSMYRVTPTDHRYPLTKTKQRMWILKRYPLTKLFVSYRRKIRHTFFHDIHFFLELRSDGTKTGDLSVYLEHIFIFIRTDILFLTTIKVKFFNLVRIQTQPLILFWFWFGPYSMVIQWFHKFLNCLHFVIIY